LRADIEAARAWLAGQSFVRGDRIGTWGFCFGGTVAFFSATLPGISAAIPFYGGNIGAGLPSGEPEMLADVARITAPLLRVDGGKANWSPPEVVERTRTPLTGAHKTFAIQVYPDQDHAFFRESSAAMSGGAQADAVKDAWSRVQAFLREHLG